MKNIYFLKFWMLVICSIFLVSLDSLQGQATNKPVREIVKQTHPAQNVEAPVLVAPMERAVLTNFPRVARFEWRTVPGAKNYELEVEINDGQWKMVKNEKVTGNSTTVELAGDNPYRWRVRAELGNGALTRWSSREFSYKTSKTESTGGQVHSGNATGNSGLKAPQLLGPADGTTFNEFPRKTKLDWSAVEGANEYEVQVQFKAGNEWVSFKNIREKSTSYTFDFRGAQPGRWRVCAIDGQKKGPFSKWSNFTYTR